MKEEEEEEEEEEEKVILDHRDQLRLPAHQVEEDQSFPFTFIRDTSLLSMSNTEMEDRPLELPILNLRQLRREPANRP